MSEMIGSLVTLGAVAFLAPMMLADTVSAGLAIVVLFWSAVALVARRE